MRPNLGGDEIPMEVVFVGLFGELEINALQSKWRIGALIHAWGS